MERPYKRHGWWDQTYISMQNLPYVKTRNDETEEDYLVHKRYYKKINQDLEDKLKHNNGILNDVLAHVIFPIIKKS
jgi:hypothetical protein